ncbi:unnamed protein product [Lota lota]
MNLFCFSLEGSIDSLYEAVQSSGDGATLSVPSRNSSHSCSRSCSRSCSPVGLQEDSTRWKGPGRSISMEIAQVQGSIAKKKKRRTHISKSASDVKALDNPCDNAAAWPAARSQEDLAHVTNSQDEGPGKSKHRTDAKGGKGSRQSGAKRKDKTLPSQSVHATGLATEPRSAAKRGQKAGKKVAGKAGKEGSRKGHSSTAPGSMCAAPQGAPSLDVSYRSYPGKASTLPAQKNSTTHPHHQWLSKVAGSSPVWADVKHTCCRPLTDYRPHSGDFAASCGREWEGTGPRATADEEAGEQDLSGPLGPPRVPCSITDIDLTDPNRSTSFGRFEGLRSPPSQSKLEDNETTMVGSFITAFLYRIKEELKGLESNKSAGLSKKMKAISLTMRRKMGKKHPKSFSEEMGDDTDREPNGEAESCIQEKASAKTRNSLESLYSGQSSSSGVTTESNGSKRDSLRLEEDGSYPGQFCGRARVHTDFVPSPYDTDSLNLKTGDIISVISKPPMGIWTGMLNNKVGNFKFIYVDVLVEKEKEEEAPKIRQQKLCRRPRPNTLLELLEQLNLQEYASALLLNGYQTVDDLMHLKEKHLIELNVKDPEHRRRLLAAADCRYTEGDEQRGAEEGKSTCGPPEDDMECLRDSGCFIPSECSDPLKEEGDPAPSTIKS